MRSWRTMKSAAPDTSGQKRSRRRRFNPLGSSSSVSLSMVNTPLFIIRVSSSSSSPARKSSAAQAAREYVEFGRRNSSTKGPNIGINQHKRAHLALCCYRILDTAGMFDKSTFKPAETWTFLDLPEYQTFCLLETLKIFMNLLIHHLKTNLTGYCSCLSQLEIRLLLTHQMGFGDKSKC